MISKISIKNFKALKDTTIEVKPLNVLMGLNGMGKSSFIQSILLLRQSDNIITGNLNLNGNYIEIGKGRDAMYQYSTEESITFSFEFLDKEELSWTFKYNPDSNYLIATNELQITDFSQYSIFNSNFQYLSAERTGPKTDYQTSSWDVISQRQVGIDGKFAIHYLNVYGNERIQQNNLKHPKAKSDILIHQVDAWLGEITPGVKLNTTEIPGTDKVLLDYQFETGSLYTNRFRPKNVGFGLSYVLPVIVALLTVKNDKLIIIENPESHIHPKGQSELGKLIALASNAGMQCIVETHSDHIINGIRVAVKEGLISKDDVNISYFERITSNDEQYAKATRIRVDESGELSEYPKHFLDEWNNQLLKLI